MRILALGLRFRFQAGPWDSDRWSSHTVLAKIHPFPLMKGVPNFRVSFCGAVQAAAGTFAAENGDTQGHLTGPRGPSVARRGPDEQGARANEAKPWTLWR